MAMQSPSAESVPPDERDLVERARLDADAEFYRRYVDRVHGFAFRRSGSQEVAEDVTSATFERALRSLHRFKWRSGGFAPWLFRIAANELIDYHRRRGRQQGDRAQRAIDRLHDPHSGDDGHSAIDRQADFEALREALDSLIPRYQRALTLRYLSDLDHREAAVSMGLSPSVMAVVVHRASAALRKTMEAGEASS